MHAQPCATDYFSIVYKGGRVNTASRTAVNSQGEVLMAGDADSRAPGPGIQQGFSNCWISKLSKAGNVLWSRRYGVEGYNTLSTRDIEWQPDGGFLALFQVFFVDASQGNQITASANIVMRGDRFGNVVWAKNIGGSKLTSFNTLVLLDNGEFLVAGTSGYNVTDVSAISLFIRMRTDGSIAWSSKFEIKGYGCQVLGEVPVLKLDNGLLVAGVLVSKIDEITLVTTQVGFFFISVNPLTGQAVWKKLYRSDNLNISIYNRFSGLQYGYEKANKDIAFVGSVNDGIPIPFSGFRKTMEILLSPTGDFKGTTLYHNGIPSNTTIQGVKIGPDRHAILTDDDSKPVVMELDGDGNILLQKSYGALSPSQMPASLLYHDNRLHLFCNDRVYQKYVRFTRTASDRGAACAETPVTLVKENGGNLLAPENFFLFEAPSGNATPPSVGTAQADYPLEVVKECEQTCCREVQGPVTEIALCNRDTYTLPGGTVVKDTGSYYEYYTTAAGCDSIAFYNISFLKTPVVDLVTPQCLDGADTLWLGAPEGVGYQYRWNNGQRSDRRFPATRAGNYTLEVSNACGSITVSIEVLDKCGVEIFMPTGFTPNGDGRNDVFAVPAQNRGKLLRFEIYNRWGRQIFSATPTTPAWNGRIGGKPAPMGAYAFVVVMAAPNGKTTQRQKGWVMLMR